MKFQARLAMAVVLGAALTAQAADLTRGTPDLKSAGALAFGPGGLLFVGDSQGGAIFAIDTNDRVADSAGGSIKVEAINEKIAGLLGTDPREVLINDLAVNPASGKAYISASRGRGPDAAPAIVRVDRSGKVELFETKDVPFARATLANVPTSGGVAKKGASPRSQAITDLAFVDGRVFVAGLSNEEFSSRLVARSPTRSPRSRPPPAASRSTTGPTASYETKPRRSGPSPPTRSRASRYLMAAYTCTPLVQVPGRSRPEARREGQGGDRSPSWATATSRWTWSSTRRTARTTY